MAVTETETTNQTPSDAGVRKPVLSESRARRIYLIIGGVVVVFLIGFLIYKFVMAGKESTDDAQVSADVVPVAARIPGQISAVYVQENQLVHRGDVIADIDPRDAAVRVAQAQGDFETAQAQAASADARLQIARAMATGGLQMAQAGVRASRDQADTLASAVNAARAAVTRAEANAQKASNDWKRAQELGGKGDISRSQLDAARAAHESAQADVASARAQLQSAINNQQTGQANIQQAQGRLTQNAPVGAEVQAAQADAMLAHAHVATAQAALDSARLTVVHENRRSRRWHRFETGRAPRRPRRAGATDHRVGAAANLRDRQFQGDAGRADEAGPTCHDPRRRARQPRFRGEGREPLRRNRSELLAAAARQRLRQLRQGRAARPGAHLVERPDERSCRRRRFGGRDGLHEVSLRTVRPFERERVAGSLHATRLSAVSDRLRTGAPCSRMMAVHENSLFENPVSCVPNA